MHTTLSRTDFANPNGVKVYSQCLRLRIELVVTVVQLGACFLQHARLTPRGSCLNIMEGYSGCCWLEPDHAIPVAKLSPRGFLVH